MRRPNVTPDPPLPPDETGRVRAAFARLVLPELDADPAWETHLARVVLLDGSQ